MDRDAPDAHTATHLERLYLIGDPLHQRKVGLVSDLAPFSESKQYQGAGHPGEIREVVLHS